MELYYIQLKGKHVHIPALATSFLLPGSGFDSEAPEDLFGTADQKPTISYHINYSTRSSRTGNVHYWYLTIRNRHGRQYLRNGLSKDLSSVV